MKRHSRAKGLHNHDAARQKQFFAKSRFEARGASATPASSMSISFMPRKRLSTSPARRRGSQQSPKNDSRSSHVYHEGIQGQSAKLHDTTLLDQPRTVKCISANLNEKRAQSPMSVELSKKRKTQRHDLQDSGLSVLEAKRQMLLRRSDWVGVGFQKPLPMTFRGPPSIHGKWGFGSKYHPLGGKQDNRWTRPFKRPQRTDAEAGKSVFQASIDIRIGSKTQSQSQSQNQSHNTIGRQYRQGLASSKTQAFTHGSNTSSNLYSSTQASLETSLRAMTSHLPRNAKAPAHARRYSNPKSTLHRTGVAWQSSSSATSATTRWAIRGSQTAPQHNHDDSMHLAERLPERHPRPSTDARSSVAIPHHIVPRRIARLQRFPSSTSSTSDNQPRSNPNCTSSVRHVTVSSECGKEEQKQDLVCPGYRGAPEVPRRTTRRAFGAPDAISESSDPGLYEKDICGPRSEHPPMCTSSGSDKKWAHVLSRYFTVSTPERLHRTDRNEELDATGGHAPALIDEKSCARTTGHSALHLQRQSGTSLPPNRSRSAELHHDLPTEPIEISFDEGIERLDRREGVQQEFISTDDDEALLRDLSLESWSQICDEPSTPISQRATPPLRNVPRDIIATSEALSNGCGKGEGKDLGEEKGNDKGRKTAWVKYINVAAGIDEADQNASDEAQNEEIPATDHVDSLSHENFKGEHTPSCYHFDSTATRGSPGFLHADKSATGVSYVSFQDSKDAMLAASAIEADGTSIGPICLSTTVEHLPSSETPETQSASCMEASLSNILPSASTTLDHASMTALPSESNGNEVESKFVRFTRPKQFKGRLATTPRRLSVPLVQLSVRNGVHSRARQRKKVVDGRPDIRALPDYYDDPIDA